MRSKITQESSVVIVTHELFYGASQALRDYLNTIKTSRVTFISHPISAEKIYSYMQVFHRGKLLKKCVYQHFSLPSIVEYIIHEILTFFWIFRIRGKYDVFIGINPLNCVAGILLRNFGLTKHVIFYAIDFTPKRFLNNFMNSLYHSLEVFCVRHADENWNVSPRIEEGRKKFLGVAKEGQKVVPIGVWQKDITRDLTKKYRKPTIIFVGHILKKQGVQEVVRALPIIIKKIPNVVFVVVGDGEYKKELEKLVKEMRVEKHVIFHGMEHDQEIIKSLLQKSSIAVACYDPSGEKKSNFTYYADPTKIKTYLANGLPVILTSISFNAHEIHSAKCGIVVDYNSNAIANAIVKLLTNSVELYSYRKQAYVYIKRYTWERVFNAAFA